MQYLDANAAAGQEGVRTNMLALDRYQQQLRERAALEQAGVTNQFSAFNEAATGLTALGGQFTPRAAVDAGGNAVYGKSAYQTWLENRKNR